MKRGMNDPMYRRGPSLYKPSTYRLHVISPGTQENKAHRPRKNRLGGASNRLTCDSPVRSPSLQAVSMRVMERSTASKARIRISPFLLRITCSNRETVPTILPLEKVRRLFKKCPAPSHGWFLNRFTSSHETNQLIYLVKQSLIES